MDGAAALIMVLSSVWYQYALVSYCQIQILVLLGKAGMNAVSWLCNFLCGLWDLNLQLNLVARLQEDPEPTKAKLEAFLKSKAIPYKYGTKTKFANFRQRTLE